MDYRPFLRTWFEAKGTLAVGQLRYPAMEYRVDAADSDALVLQVRGVPRATESTLNGRTTAYESRPGLIHVCGRGDAVRDAWCGPMGFVGVFLDPGFLRAVGVGLVGEGQPVRVASRRALDDAVLRSLVEALRGLTAAPEPKPDRLLLEQIGGAIGRRLLAVSGAPLAGAAAAGARLPAWRLRQVEEFVEAHLERTVSLADLATAAGGMSPLYFARLFRRSVGFSPHAYLTRRRVERARALLGEPARTLTEVARAVGFSDQPHLNRAVRRVLGLTPGELRAAARGGRPRWP